MKGARVRGGPAPVPAHLIASWFGAGHLPRIPGTWGSLAALPFAWAIAAAGGPAALAVAAGGLFFLGWWAAERVSAERGIADPGSVVIDEVVGQWLVLAAAPRHLVAYAVAFALFRIADIVKPWPASWADRSLRGGLGIMLDDVFAALYAGAGILALARWRLV